MQIKKFEAKTMTEALKKVKQDLGSDAVILSARSLDTAKGFMGNMKKRKVEVTAAIDMEVGKPLDESTKRVKDRNKPYKQNPYMEKKNLIQSIRGGIQSVTGKMNPLTAKTVEKEKNTDLLKIQQSMISNGIKEEVAVELLGYAGKHASLGTNRIINEKNIKKSLIDLFDKIGIVAGSIKLEPKVKKIIAFAGPTGVGKTSTIAKIATYQAISLKKKVGLITLDNYRIAANARLEILSKIIGVSMKTASNGQQLLTAIRELKGFDLILIDTPGMSPRDDFKINELKVTLGKAAPVEVHLLLSIVTGEKDLQDIINRFKVIPVDRLIFTKLDESPEYGRVLNTLMKHKIPVSYCTTGQQIPESIEEITTEWLADIVVPEERKNKVKETTGQTMQSDGRDLDMDDPDDSGVKYVGHKATSIENAAGYVANKNSDIFHYHNCKWTKMIKKENMLVFENETDAKNASFKPCRSCCPSMGEDRQSNVVTAGRGSDKIAGYR